MTLIEEEKIHIDSYYVWGIGRRKYLIGLNIITNYSNEEYFRAEFDFGFTDGGRSILLYVNKPEYVINPEIKIPKEYFEELMSVLINENGWEKVCNAFKFGYENCLFKNIKPNLVLPSIPPDYTLLSD